MTPRLVVESLVCGHERAHPVLDGVDLTVGDGETVVLVGPSGCGKTTLLKTVLGLVPPLAGGYAVLGVNGGRRPPPGGVGYIPQGLGLVRHVSVLKNVLMGSLPRLGWLRSATSTYPRPVVHEARDALAAVGLAHKADEKPIHLSGGERRRVAIARAMVQRPQLLLADEILSELDIATSQVVLEGIRVLQRDTNMSLLLVEHNLDVAWTLADRVLCLKDGRIAATFAPVTDDPTDLREVFLAAP